MPTYQPQTAPPPQIIYAQPVAAPPPPAPPAQLQIAQTPAAQPAAALPPPPAPAALAPTTLQYTSPPAPQQHVQEPQPYIQRKPTPQPQGPPQIYPHPHGYPPSQNLLAPSQFHGDPPPFHRPGSGPPPAFQGGNGWDNPPVWNRNDNWNGDGANGWGRNQFRELAQEYPPPFNSWRAPRPQSGPPRGRGGGGGVGPVRNFPRNQAPRNMQPRPTTLVQAKPYERTKPTMRQSSMPFFATLEGKFTQLCVYTAQDQPCPNKNCEFSHEPKNRRICPMYHNPKERCPFNPASSDMTKRARPLKHQRHLAESKDWPSSRKDLLKTAPQQKPDEPSADKTNAPIQAAETGTPKPATENQTEAKDALQINPLVHFEPEVATAVLKQGLFFSELSFNME
jgi:hypothetical protein